MIDIVYNREHHRVTMRGHAGSAETGHDIVCASASILAYTLAANVASADAERQVRNTVLRLDEGDAEISCAPVRKWAAVITVLFDAICSGFDLLAQRYPENVRYEVRG